MAVNLKYSFGDFTGQTLTHLPASDFRGDIIGSCFSQEALDTIVFPAGITATFLRCNLDNCVIPVGASVGSTQGINSTTKRIAIQNDKESWFVDGDNNPIEPMNKAEFIKYRISVDPADIPGSLIDETRIETRRKAIELDREARKKAIDDEPIPLEVI